MRVFIVKNDKEETDKFMKIVEEQLNEYGIEFQIITSSNVSINKRRLDSSSLVVVCNGSRYKDDIESFIEEAVQKEAEIWPIAINKEDRLPEGPISRKQSYDVWEQLRRRNLDKSQISTIALSFSRKIIARVLPTLYNENGEIFISHRRLDGEDIAAKIYDRLKMQAESMTPFRDVARINVGEEAQPVIDEAMKDCEIFIFVHTPKAAESEWILKELLFAMLRCIPVLWIQIDDADEKKLKIKPSEKPHLQYKSENFIEEKDLIEIADEILDKSFSLIMENSHRVFDYIKSIESLFGSRIICEHQDKMIYRISMERKGYHYPQRTIEQYFQVFGRMPTDTDLVDLNPLKENEKLDSVVALSNKTLNFAEKHGIIMDSIEDFYYYWNEYIEGKKEKIKLNRGEIVISGAFPDCDEIYKQCLTDALVIFSKAIIREGYILTFGAHPTFQELFFETARKTNTHDAKNSLKMFISNWFMERQLDKEEYYKMNCHLFKTEKKEDLNKSLQIMRRKMIQRREVKALVCLGGKIKKNKEEEGIREEIELARAYDIPVFIVGTVGGCSAEVAIEYQKSGWKNLNDASDEINEEFLNSIDYFGLVRTMLKLVEDK